MRYGPRTTAQPIRDWFPAWTEVTTVLPATMRTATGQALRATPSRPPCKPVWRTPTSHFGGSKFIDVSSLMSVDGFYDFTEHTDVVEVQAGANFRQYRLDSEGTLYNDGPLGFGEPIPVNEFGGFVQVGKSVLDDHLTVRASARFDKNENYEGRFTPRASVVAALDPDKNHYLRGSFQTGFRNPSPQESYIALDLGPAILIGGLEDNLENYNYLLPDDVTTVNGLDIWNGLVSFESFLAFLGTGDPTVFELADLDSLIQEQNNTFEVGYRGLIGDKPLHRPQLLLRLVQGLRRADQHLQSGCGPGLFRLHQHQR